MHWPLLLFLGLISFGLALFDSPPANSWRSLCQKTGAIATQRPFHWLLIWAILVDIFPFFPVHPPNPTTLPWLTATMHTPMSLSSAKAYVAHELLGWPDLAPVACVWANLLPSLPNHPSALCRLALQAPVPSNRCQIQWTCFILYLPLPLCCTRHFLPSWNALFPWISWSSLLVFLLLWLGLPRVLSSSCFSATSPLPRRGWFHRCQQFLLPPIRW